MKPAIIIGTKAEYIKMFPVMLELQKRKIDYLFIATGQHNLTDLIKQFKTKTPDIIINPKDGFKGDTGGAVGWGFKTLPKTIKELKKHYDIQYVLVHGDTISTLIGAVAGRLTGKRICHVEAGLRSGNLFEPMPEEAVRRIVDFLSFIKFAPSEKSAKRVNGINTGNTSFDAMNIALKLNNTLKLKLPKVFAVASIHRHEAIKDKKKMEQIVEVIRTSKIPVLWFLHKNTEKVLKDYDLLYRIQTSLNVFIVEPLEYSQFVHVLKKAQYVIGDGGSLAEELSYLNIPYFCLRNETEREELLYRFDQKLIPFNKPHKYILVIGPRKKYYIKSPYENGNASKNIVDFLAGLNG